MSDFAKQIDKLLKETRDSQHQLQQNQAELLFDMREEITRLRSEVLEQARLLGMSGEREAKLLARVEVLEKMIATVQNASADSKYLYRDEAINRLSIIRAALEAKP
jgi:flagellar basal body rod protein FlgF